MKRKTPIRLTVVAIVAILLTCFFALDLGQYLTLEYIQDRREDFLEFYEGNRALTIGVYVAIYVASTALSLPGATILTLVGGAIFGVLAGTVIVSFASTAGATLAFLASRLLLRDSVQRRFRDRLATINRGVERDGAFYLFTLRLIPAFPFFVINLVMGLTPITTLKFFLVSQIGMLPGTVVYVNAGTQLAQLESVSGILSPDLILSFAALGVFPLLARLLVNFMRRRRYLGKFEKPRTFDYNVVVIGAGSGGLVASYIAAALRARVALVEKEKMGGDCLNTGCVPSKALIRSTRLLAIMRRAREFGLGDVEIEVNFRQVMERVQRVITRIEPHDSMERYRRLGVDCIGATGRILTPYEVEVDGRRLTTRSIVIATGGRPAAPPFEGADRIEWLSSDTVWNLRELPRRLAVLGGGPIGCELAQCFQRLGSSVTLVEFAPRLLPREDPEVSDLVMASFRREGMRVLTGHAGREFVSEGDRKMLLCEHQGEEVRVEFDEVLCALGRTPNTAGFGLEDLEVQLGPRGTVETDPFLRTNYPNIYAVGDVAGPYQFTHTASHQAWYAAVNALFSPFWSFRVDYRVIPWCTFTDPEVGRVGLSEEEARARGIEYETTTYGLEELDRAIADGEDRGLVKVLTPPGKDRILGALIVGEHAGDCLVEFVAAMKQGFGLNDILGTIHVYPTLAEANKYVAGNWKLAHAPGKLLDWLARFHDWRRRAGRHEGSGREGTLESRE